ncbi:hypothetical protein MX003_04515 [Streptococcus uberis]|uniref:hypothetical protein n=1 Tax=Streptococcus uberis TaxID=1349 RepID=UPI0027DB9969|nr:hypothetical protein [Streptococcus uberis]MCK1236953.1 hypothetical protein [Streptococcus uberis]
MYIESEYLNSFSDTVNSLIKNGKIQDGGIRFLTKNRIKQLLQCNENIDTKIIFFPMEKFTKELLKHVISTIYLDKNFMSDPIRIKLENLIDNYIMQNYPINLCPEAKVFQYLNDNIDKMLQTIYLAINCIDETYDSKRVEEKVIKEFFSYDLFLI